MTRHDATCPVTAQRVRDIAGVVDECDAGDLLALADWLDTYDPEQLGEAMELLEDAHEGTFGVLWDERTKVLLQEWEGKEKPNG